MAIIRTITEADRIDWVRLRDALWPGSPADHEREASDHFATRREAPVVFVAAANDRIVGFLELDYRKYAAGCSSSPVPFIEGWYVEPAYRARGTGRALVHAAEQHARSAGYTEIASDADVGNVDGIAAHRALGYEEIERVVCFRRVLTDVESCRPG